MARGYNHVKVFEKEIFKMKEAGKTNREIAEHFGFKDKYVINDYRTNTIFTNMNNLFSMHNKV